MPNSTRAFGRAFVAAGVLVFLAAAADRGAAAWVETRVTETPSPSSNPDVTYDANDALHVLWEEAGEVRHVIHDGAAWGTVDVVGTGIGFDRHTCWT